MAADRADTIAAIATPPGAGGIGVIRVSGPLAGTVARQLLGRQPQPRHAHYLTLRDSRGEILDTGLLLYFAGPASFTGEDVVELHLHGSRPVLRMALRRLEDLGVRQARAGEFSERAFLNDKLDLAQAEAIADLIAAGSEAAARAAQRSLQGEFSRTVEDLSEAVIALRVRVEAAIDFADEDIEALAPARLRSGLDALLARLDRLRETADRGRRLVDGLHVVILGPPNVGKSSLLNALAADERAIVTPQAGTTRDLLRETVLVDGVELTLVDTAGLRDSTDPIEQEGIRRARLEAGNADLVLQLVESGKDGTDPWIAPAGIPGIVIHTKIDLDAQAPRREWREAVEHIHLSARTGAGLELLRQSLAQRAGGDAQGSFSARARHVEALDRTRSHLLAAGASLVDTSAWELAAEDLRLAHASLGEITGAMSSDALLGRIFANFCIGK